jgi:hypothetical protein
MIKQNQIKYLAATSAFLFLACLVFSPNIVLAKAKAHHHGGGGGGGGHKNVPLNQQPHCPFSCNFVITKNGVTYSVAGHVTHTCDFAFNCQELIDDAMGQISPTNLSYDWSLICGNEHGYTATIIPPAQPACKGSSCLGGSGCGTGQYYCELFKQCLPNGAQCNAANPDYTPAVINPNIPATEGPVRLKTLSTNPPIGNPSYTCKISWGDSFASYDKDTHCTFTGGSTSMSFDPTSSDAPTSFTSPALTHDTSYTMSCKEGATGNVIKTETSCRINWNYKEVN